MNTIVLALVLVQVTTADGAKVYVNPEAVVKLYPTKEATEKKPNQLVVTGARCVVTLNDGKFLAVLEPCDYVLTLLGVKTLPGRRVP
jgi:hypothetical protein